MKLRFNRQETADALGAICSVAVPRTPKDILKNVRLEAKSDVLLLSATDLELSLRCSVTQVEVDEPGEVLVSAETFAKIVRECDDELLTLELSGNTLHIRGAGSHFQIVTHDLADFPPIPDLTDKPDITIGYEDLKRLIDRSAFSAARESTRYAINGVLWELEGKRLTLAATDGRRLAVAHGRLEKAAPKARSAIVPGKTLALFSRLPVEPDTQVGVKITDNQLQMNMGRSVLSSALVEGQFPQYQDVIPDDCDREVELNTAEFQSALKRAALLTNEESKGVRLCFSEGTLTLTSRAPDQGEATISLPIEYKGETLEIGFNPVFFLDVLRVLQAETLTLAFKQADRPGVIRLGEEFTYVIMPVNLTSA